MKKIIAIALLALTITIATASAADTLYTKQADGTFAPVLATNAQGVPFLSGPAMDLLSSISTWTNWGVATFGIYEPASANHKASYGAGAVALYNIGTWAAAGIGIDWLDNRVTMPSAQFQLQAPFLLAGKLQVTPFAFTGVATPIAGMGQDNGAVVGIFGAGLDVKIAGGFGAFYAIEDRTGQPALWHLLGIRYSKAL